MRKLMTMVVGAALVAAACTGSKNYWHPYSPATGQTTKTNAQAVQQAVVALTDAGRDVESSDAETGIVLSKWFSGDGFGGGNNRFRIRVTIADGAYTVMAMCQAKDPMSGGWEDTCDAGKRPQFVLDAVAKVEAGLE